MSGTFQLIHQAILNRQQIVAVYLDRTRFLCPHVLGYKNGREQCLFYQFGGTSETELGPVGSPRNWRCIPVAGLSDVRVQDGEWFSSGTLSRAQTCVKEVVVSVYEPSGSVVTRRPA